jgi:MFS family permease
MLRYIFLLDVSLAILGAAMVIGVGVSALLLALYLDSSPEYRGMTMNLTWLTVVYLAVTLSSAAGGWGIHKKAAWHWIAQALFAVSLVASYRVSVQLLTNT